LAKRKNGNAKSTRQGGRQGARQTVRQPVPETPEKPGPPPKPAPPPPWHPPRNMGLARAMHHAGWGTRREVEAVVAAGRVDLDGKRCTDPRAPVTPASEIALDGRPLVEVGVRYYAFHKPARVVCSAIDASHQRLVADFLPRDIPGLRAAGRLDSRTTGLILVSNDPAWNTAVTGNVNLEQEYRLHVEGELTDLEVGVLTAGVHLPNLGVFRPLSVAVLECGGGRTALSLVVRGGKIRQVRRMFSTLRHKITLLRRVRIGDLRLGDLPAGGLRPLTEREARSLAAVPDPSDPDADPEE
jgi:23S rRNA pseudouridine2605 synthase